MNQKTFQDLIEEVHNKGICQECGGCVSFCSSAEYNVIGFEDPYSPPHYINEDKCLECGICYYICPQTHILDEELNETFQFSNYHNMPMGHVQRILSCQATDDHFLKYGTDGGVVNSLINYLIKKNRIDGAIVSETEAPFSRNAFFAKSKESLLKASGAKLEISPQLDELQKFSTYPQTIPEINHFKFKKLAIVGTPCQIYTIRCMQDLGVTPSQNIEICLGLFCYENFIFTNDQKRKFEKDFNVELSKVKKINIKQDLILNIRDINSGEKTIHIPFNHLENYMRPACNACSDFTNIYADISFGGLGSPENYTTLLVRTNKGKLLVDELLDSGIIIALDLNNDDKERMKNLIADFSSMKRTRKEKFMKTL
ncbi:MAG: Coenzyme F420 hydrogenase subunit beta [Promethearchaeota archaeon]|nr:MAG: Coenzyme F420 hydrogenase subunit beta [Candidatus Lokiarchaeota archaeon]